jgi:NADPH:quinone reductase-like Zn-dependent oxidoreductase
MQAIVARDRAAGISGLSLAEMPYPHAAENDVVVRVHAASFIADELDWPGTWRDRAGRDRVPTIPGHEVSGVVVELGYGTTGLTVGQRVFGLTDWARNGTLAEYVAVEARNLAPLSADVDHIAAVALPMTGLTAWQGLFDHGQLETGQTVLIHGAAGSVGSIAVQLAREAGAKVDVVFDVLGGEILDRSAQVVRSGGVLVTVAEPPRVRPENARAIFFVVEPDRIRLTALERKLRHGSLQPTVGAVLPLADAPSAFDPARRARGKTVIRVAEDE